MHRTARALCLLAFVESSGAMMGCWKAPAPPVVENVVTRDAPAATPTDWAAAHRSMQSLGQAGRIAEAVVVARELCAMESATASARLEALLLLANFAKENGDQREASARFSELSELLAQPAALASDCDELRLASVSLALRLDQPARALELAQTLLGDGVAPALRIEAALSAAGLFAARDMAAAALQVLADVEPLCESQRQRSRVAYQRGVVCERFGRYHEARGEFARAAELVGVEGRWVSARFREAACLAQLGKDEESVGVLRTILAAEPEHWPAVLSLAELDLAAGRFVEAEAGFRRVAEVLPTEERASAGIARARALQQTSLTTEGGESSKERVRVALRLAEKFVGDGKNDNAVVALRAALTHLSTEADRPRRLELLRLIGDIEARGAKWTQAEKTFRECLLLVAAPGESTGSNDGRGDLALRLAECLRRADRPIEAYDLLVEEFRAGTRHARLPLNLGALAIYANRPGDAVEWYGLALKEELVESERAAIEATIAKLRAAGSAPSGAKAGVSPP
ncbi:MAG: tetratricopeptide repeat protein [Planctomycetota bacterium]